MKIYVLIYEVDYEGGEYMGVFNSIEAAQEKANSRYGWQEVIWIDSFCGTHPAGQYVIHEEELED